MSYPVSYADAFATGLARLGEATLISCNCRELAPLMGSAGGNYPWGAAIM